LKDVAAVEALFAEISGDWIDRYTRADRKPVLLVDFSKLAISPSVTESYAEQVRKHRPRFEAVYRYNAGIGFTGVAVNLGSVKAGDETNLFADEASARAAIRASRAR
jgi:hypothetical protein